MGLKDTVNALIDANIYANGEEKITGQGLNDTLKSVVEMLPTTEEIVSGWTTVSEEIEDGERVVKKIASFTGGVPPLPQALTDLIGKYFAAGGGFTSDISLATNYKGVAADPSKLPLYSAIKSANIAAGTQFIDDENGNIQYRVLAGQTLAVGELPANFEGEKVAKINYQDILDILRLDFDGFHDYEIRPEDRSAMTFATNENTSAYYYEGTSHKGASKIYLRAYGAGNVNLGFIKPKTTTGELLYVKNVAVVDGINTFNVADLAIPADVLAQDYVIGVKPDIAGRTRFQSSSVGSLTVMSDSSFALTPTTNKHGLWVLVDKEFELDKLPKLMTDFNSILDGEIITESVDVPENRNNLNLSSAGSNTTLYGEEEIWFNSDHPLNKLSIYARGAGIVEIYLVRIFGSQILHTVEKTCVVGLNEFTLTDLGYTTALTDDKIHVFVGNKNTATPNVIHGAETFAVNHTWYYLTKSNGIISSQFNKQRFSYWINREQPLPFFADETITTKFTGKKGVSFGDSITWYDGKAFNVSHAENGQIAAGYQSYVREHFNATYDNQGRSGYSMIEILPVIKAYASFANTDFVTLTSGANDTRKGVPFGTVGEIGSTFNETTFAGAMQSAIEFMLNTKPTMKIYLITPIKGWFNEVNTANVPATSIEGMQILRQYVDIIFELGKLYSLPVCNWYDNVFINKITRPNYIGDILGTPYYLHPNNAGFKLMGEKLIWFLENN